MNLPPACPGSDPRIFLMMLGGQPFAQITTARDLDPVVLRRACGSAAPASGRVQDALQVDEALYQGFRAILSGEARARFDEAVQARHKPESAGGASSDCR
jgi:hypothetical protein